MTLGPWKLEIQQFYLTVHHLLQTHQQHQNLQSVHIKYQNIFLVFLLKHIMPFTYKSTHNICLHLNSKLNFEATEKHKMHEVLAGIFKLRISQCMWWWTVGQCVGQLMYWWGSGFIAITKNSTTCEHEPNLL